MRHPRRDYDAIQPWPVKRPHNIKIDGELRLDERTNGDDDEWAAMGEPLIPDDEPVFLLRGQDPAAAEAVRAYAQAWVRVGGDEKVAVRIAAWADEMSAYAKAKRHGPPDVPDGMLRG